MGSDILKQYLKDIGKWQVYLEKSSPESRRIVFEREFGINHNIPADFIPTRLKLYNTPIIVRVHTPILSEDSDGLGSYWMGKIIFKRNDITGTVEFYKPTSDGISADFKEETGYDLEVPTPEQLSELYTNAI